MATFHPFSLLPFELRLKIWTLASNHPRTLPIHIGITTVPSTSTTTASPISTVYKLTHIPPHALFSVCNESHTLIASLSSSIHLPSSPSKRIFFNPSHDLLYLDIETLVHLASPELFDKFRGCGWDTIENVATSLTTHSREEDNQTGGLWELTGMARVLGGVLTGFKGQVGVWNGTGEETLKREVVEMWRRYWGEALEWEGVKGSRVGRILEGSLESRDGERLAEQFFRRM